MENAEEEEKRCYCVRTQVLKTQVPSGYFAHIGVPSLANWGGVWYMHLKIENMYLKTRVEIRVGEKSVWKYV